MPFTLYKDDPADPPKRIVSFDDLDNKAFWCNLGEDKEHAFVKVMSKIQSPYTISIHPEKENNPYHPDLLVNINNTDHIGEAKIKNSPLFIARRYGVNPQYALTMDLKDSFNYDKLLTGGIDLIIFIWVKWEAHEMITSYNGTQRNTYKVSPMRGIWVTLFSRLRKKEQSTKPPGIHWYNEQFRKPPIYNINDESNHRWIKELVEFEPRLKTSNNVKNITSIGYDDRADTIRPTGHSSGSYVFDLSDADIFYNIYLRS